MFLMPLDTNVNLEHNLTKQASTGAAKHIARGQAQDIFGELVTTEPQQDTVNRDILFTSCSKKLYSL